MTPGKVSVGAQGVVHDATAIVAVYPCKHDEGVFEDASRLDLGLIGLVERIWAGISAESAPGEYEAAQIAAEELTAARGATPSR